MKNMIRLAVILVSLSVLTNTAAAATVTGKVPAGYSVVAVSSGKSASSGSSPFSLSTSGTQYRLYLLKNGVLDDAVIAAVKKGSSYYSFSDAIKQKICKKSGAKLVMGLQGNASLGGIKIKSGTGVAFLSKLPAKKLLDKSTLTAVSDKNKCLPEGTGATLGLASAKTKAKIARRPGGRVRFQAAADDADGDGLIDAFDIDKDNDGVLNAYDSDSAAVPDSSSFHIFSNFKLPVTDSLNAYTQTLTTADIDKAAGNLTLAIQVAGENSDAVELNCGGLTYCSSGGTGTANNSKFPESADSDSDGFGTITRGGSGDFQLQTHVTSASAIGAGDTLIELVDSSGTASEIAGMLNFTFNTTPAVKTLSMGGVATDLVYPSQPSMAGSNGNPLTAPVGWDGKLTIVAYRPQRPGVSAAGEGDFVDIGNSLITIDIPNGPCTNGSGCVPQGPGNCTASAYSSSDTNISADPNGLKDKRADQDTDTAAASSNTLTFTIDLDQCLNSAAGGPINWGAGQYLGIDLQFRNSSGDNAAQKFFIAKQ